MSCDCCVTLPRGTMGLSAVCDLIFLDHTHSLLSKKVYWMCLRIGVTCNLALSQVKQWLHYVWCWRHRICSVISDKYPSLKTFWKMSLSQKWHESLVLLQWNDISRITHLWFDTISFHCRKYQFYWHLICFDFTTYDKIKSIICIILSLAPMISIRMKSKLSIIS